MMGSIGKKVVIIISPDRYPSYLRCINYQFLRMNKFEATLKKYVDIFLNQEMYFVNDLKNMELFHQIPLNVDVGDVRSKLSAMNDTDINHNALMEDAIKHIINLKVDERISRGDLSVVEDISNISGGS